MHPTNCLFLSCNFIRECVRWSVCQSVHQSVRNHFFFSLSLSLSLSLFLCRARQKHTQADMKCGAMTAAGHVPASSNSKLLQLKMLWWVSLPITMMHLHARSSAIHVCMNCAIAQLPNHFAIGYHFQKGQQDVRDWHSNEACWHLSFFFARPFEYLSSCSL